MPYLDILYINRSLMHIAPSIMPFSGACMSIPSTVVMPREVPIIPFSWNDSCGFDSLKSHNDLFQL